MAINDLPILSALRTKMQWHQERQRVLAENVSNADTPEFRPHDLVQFDFKKQLRETARMPLAGGENGHLSGTIVSKTGFKDGQERNPYETAPAGNAVVLEEQMIKVGQNAMEYQTVTNLYRKQVCMLKTAMTPPR